MTQKRRKTVKRTNKKQKKTSNRTKRMRFTKKWVGGCGCGAKFTGGACNCKTTFRGGSPFLNQLDSQHFYKYSDHNQDPTNPNILVNERLAGDFSRTMGGKKRKMRKLRKMKGGSNILTDTYNTIANTGSNMNFITSFGMPNGVGSQLNLLNASHTSNNSDTMIHPVSVNPYGFQNRPVV